jgi:ABC-type branched-subunit amino acid transport system ATPase component
MTANPVRTDVGLALRAHQVRKRFGGLVAVNDVSVDVVAGSITAMIGPNGAGKTTLFNVLTRFEPANGGTIEFFGTRVESLTPWQVARVGMVRSFQTPVGFPTLSVWENLMVGAADLRGESLGSGLLGRRSWGRKEREASARAREVLTDLGLWDERDVLLEDLAAGDVKLVDFARQMIAQPRMLLLDEPAAGVDPASIGRLASQIRRLRDRDGATVFIIDHNIGFVLGIADYVYVMAEGSVVAQGPPDEVARDPYVIEIYLGSTS